MVVWYRIRYLKIEKGVTTETIVLREQQALLPFYKEKEAEETWALNEFGSV